ncbi:MAG: NAD(+)/NADH kinase [Faecalibacterium sp.]
MNIYMVPNLSKDENACFTLRAAKILAELGANLLFSEEMTPFLPSDVSAAYTLSLAKECYEQADVILTIGGDGTILHEAIQSLAYQKPILGVNLGRCGFLATCEEDEMQEKFQKLVCNEYILDKRHLLSACIQEAGNSIVKTARAEERFALNDVVISKGTTQQSIDLSIYCDDILVESYRGDGVIIATPTGSTAYSLAAGGPIVDAQTMGIVLTAICPHKLRAPSMVFAPKRVLRVVLGNASRGAVFLSCDGQTEVMLQEREAVEITLSDNAVQLVSFSSAAQFEAIDRKLKNKD